ncbi:MAG: hypothetical protein HKO60_01640 [Pseudomonadales bacterium]|nr:hypothetical protein [Pseudomonadales bacterium]
MQFMKGNRKQSAVLAGSKKLLAALSLLPIGGFVSAQTMNLSDLPLNVQSEIPPNIIVSLDDSGSMAWGWMPDGRNADRDQIWYRSSHFNKIYYDPTVDYVAPNNSDGSAGTDANYFNARRGYYYPGSFVDIDLSTSFRALYYHYSTGALSWRGAAQPAFYYQFSDDVTVNPSCTGTPAQNLRDANCYTQVVIETDTYPNAQGRTLAQERTNFANWFQYYGNRADASKSAMRRAFTPQSVRNTVRLGRQSFNQDQSVRSGSETQDNNNLAELTPTERAGFYSWVDSVRTSGGTPLRRTVYRAGEYFKNDKAYYANASSKSGPLIGCRVNTHIMVTDGYYNGGFTTPTNFRRDQTDVTLPDAVNYVAANTPVYRNANDSSSISDLTFHYWATDLRPEANNITPFESNIAGIDVTDYWDPRNDPATWQHMNSFGIAFGAEGTVPTDDATLQQLIDGTISWPNTNTGQPTTIDDLYHSSLNGRGDFYNAVSPDELVNALNEITNRIGDRQGNAPQVGASSGRISDGSKVYIASFSTESWSGDLQSFQISDGSDFKSGLSGCNSKPLGSICNPDSPIWSVEEKNDELESHMQPASRKIFTYNNTAGAGSGQPAGTGINFEWNASTPLTATQQALLNGIDGLGKDRVNYLRGDDSNERDNGGDFRTRSSIAGGTNPASRTGPIIHSNPTYAGPGGTELQFALPPGLEANDYAIPSRTPVVYAGGNDGMLHAFDASNGASAGTEIFAYVPDMLMPKLSKLTEPGFKSGAYVDGPLALQDAYYDGSWRSLLVGGLRTGGQGYFALDVTNPPTGATANPSSIVEWEFSDFHDSDMGFSFGEPIIAKANNGEWVVIVANGYNSTVADGRVGSGKAVLFVLAADDGEVLAKIPVGNGSAGSPSGLSSPVAVSDIDVDHFTTLSNGTDADQYTVDYVYAGDLEGKLWKFDLSSTNPANWNSAALMYNAGSGQAITAKPAVGTFPTQGSSASNKQYRFVYFGTGKYNEPNDVFSKTQQSFYGIVDDDTWTSSSSAAVTKSDMVEQTFSGNFISSNPLASTDKGWWLDLEVGSSAERVVGGLAVVSNVVAFTTVQPNGNPCDAGGTSYLYALNRFSGGATSSQVIDYNSDGEITSSDYGTGDTVQSRKELGSIVIDTNLLGGPSEEFVLFAESGAEVLKSTDRKGRVRWRQIK